MVTKHYYKTVFNFNVLINPDGHLNDKIKKNQTINVCSWYEKFNATTKLYKVINNPIK